MLAVVRKLLLEWHLDDVVSGVIKCRAATMTDDGTTIGDQLVSLLICHLLANLFIRMPYTQVIQVLTLDLIDGKHSELTHQEECLILVAVVLLLGNGLPEDDFAAPLAAGNTVGPTHDLTTE